jgi:hypothetical protein
MCIVHITDFVGVVSTLPKGFGCKPAIRKVAKEDHG